MKKTINCGVLFATLIIVTSFCACKKTNTSSTQNFNINQTVLVADTAGFGATKIDPVLQDAWGLASSPGGPLWIAANHSGLSTIYDNTGNILSPPVSIPSVTPGMPGAPSGVVFNSTQDFGVNSFIFASEEGIVLAWKSGTSAVKVADQTQANAVYKGLTIASNGGSNFLYVTNFHDSKIDVFDKNFNYVSGSKFNDPGIPAGFGPFNIQNIGGQLYITYAKLQGPNNMDDQAGAGNGFVDIFNPDGSFVKRFASQGTLNSPWGIALAPAGFANAQPTILIGNFGDGRINIFDMAGNYKGQLQNNGQTIAIPGLWAIDFLKNNQPGGSPNDPLYFTAGPDDEAHGLFGTLQLQQQSTNVNNTNPNSGNTSYGY
ncbi:TIGR03118 family protein [Mucilaginibacter sp. X4EP1]|uniref:TIGR03118 family protein n=1 Tax=Mucilaginibacter sp. X4EP1 TaxID=2723092 RepID=UPI002168461B|nr:TIGR03118 family protein [Mucilaginibacter sp. X4EP1]MCS3813043.1 uncharacterized protein (TIGR03118 family) [Mucilaginibacter sp. X4EP1]